MYGMVNNAIKQLVLNEYGTETWKNIFEDTSLISDDFFNMEQYEDGDSVALVVSASNELGMTPAAFLEALGVYWITYAMESDYGDLLEMAGDSLPEVLENLDSMHTRVGDSFEELLPPSFWISDEEENRLHLHYASERKGLAPMVVGLVKGLGKLFNLDCEVTHIESASEGADHDIFSVIYSPVNVEASMDKTPLQSA